MIQVVTKFTRIKVFGCLAAALSRGYPTQKDIEMKLKLAAIAALFCGSAFAQTGTVQRDVNQQERIEQGLKSGQLTTREAARLEREEAKVERDQARALRDGTLSPAEKARLAREQNKVSRDIYREKHDAQTGDPSSPSSQRSPHRRPACISRT